jgi:hypothetical protein
LTIVVQDLPEIVAEGKQMLASSPLCERIEFVSHNFFEPQPEKADVFFLKRIFHDWPDKYCSKILGNLVSALNPGGKIIFADSVMPPPNVLPKLVERRIRYVSCPTTHPRLADLSSSYFLFMTWKRDNKSLTFSSSMDMIMLGLFNSKERTVEEWQQLLSQTDQSLRISSMNKTPDGHLNVIIAERQSGSNGAL